MNQPAVPQEPNQQPHNPHDQDVYVLDTRVSSFDMTSAFLIACIAVVGLMTFIAFLIWLTLFEWGHAQKTVTPIELAGNDDRPEGIAEDPEEPGVEEFPEVEQPQLADALEAMTDAVSSVKAQLEKVDGNALEMGTGTGLGDIREKGRGSGTGRGIPEAERWRIEYSAKSVSEYTKQLQYFRIELGAVSKKTSRIDLISNISASRPSVNVTDKSNEKRIYFSYQASRLKRWDQSIARKAGISDIKQRIIVQFYEEDVRAILRRLEAEVYQAEGKDLLEVKRCHFRVRPRGNGYEFFVHKIEYRPMPRS